MDVPDGGYTSKPTLHRKSSFNILSKCILRFLRINSLCPGNKKRVKNAGIPFFQEVRESENTVKCYHKDKIPRAFTLRKKPGNLINIRNNTFKKSPPNSVLEEKAVLFP